MAFLQPQQNRAVADLDGIDDPLHDKFVLFPDRKPYNKDTDGKLYLPTTGGYQRTKTTLRGEYPITVNDTTGETVLLLEGYDSNHTYLNQRLLSVYQDSGGALTFSVYSDSGKTKLIYSKSINDSTWTPLTDMWSLTLPDVYVAWSGAAGTNQHLLTVQQRAYAISDV